MKVLVTGAAGFIGFHVSKKLLERGDDVVGFDNMNDYYDPALKQARVDHLVTTAEQSTGQFNFIHANLADKTAVDRCFQEHQFDRVIHLAAQAGVRYSLENPMSYVESNIVGFTHIIEACRYAKTPHLTYASTSSVYGANTTMPFSEEQGVNHPIQFYAATKRANELMAHSYSHLFKLPTTGLRFFTVYGPWGRPDMAPFKFTKNIIEGKSIQVFNHGNHTRDFTFVEDIAEGVIRSSDQIAEPNLTWDSNHPDPSTSNAPFRIFNIGNSTPVQLIDFIRAIENSVGKKALIEMLPLQEGDVPDTLADSSALEQSVGYKPSVSVDDGVKQFVDWYRDFYQI
ncbi:NAD-dependent epimerase [Acinetobacter bohemicus]|uniref:NAD-dependent epimerase n=1 Tax=Acinetobacter lwoffii TaxID=28090 RepID=A0A9D2ZYZ8_ACILW|nr:MULTISPECIES: NAD-dependent epimerase [Acinetobacter]MDM1780769.1 NAD-dependent epimerase [Acinetobacter indicus]HJF27783.1 NAD-dependent epimerase [Acinetobacter lwoffii]MCO8042567.1 NAD-dependent epimerase [Acinetobacter sp. S4400-12]MCO8046250.1 NAD-dependent epimerase [Acinetobacter sp. S4397-1]MCU7224894.1 NAD-dependent epimerase [Acinetobacter bohemicus]